METYCHSNTCEKPSANTYVKNFKGENNNINRKQDLVKVSKKENPLKSGLCRSDRLHGEIVSK